METSAVILALAQMVASIAALVAAVGAILVGMRNARKIEQVHRTTNSMKDELVAAVGKQQRAEGVIEGRADEKRDGQGSK